MEINWERAPFWARFLTIDGVCTIIWWENRPEFKVELGIWMDNTGGRRAQIQTGPTMFTRPQGSGELIMSSGQQLELWMQGQEHRMKALEDYVKRGAKIVQFITEHENRLDLLEAGIEALESRQEKTEEEVSRLYRSAGSSEGWNWSE